MHEKRGSNVHIRTLLYIDVSFFFNKKKQKHNRVMGWLFILFFFLALLLLSAKAESRTSFKRSKDKRGMSPFSYFQTNGKQR